MAIAALARKEIAAIPPPKTPSGITVAVRAQPRAGRNAILGPYEDAAGRRALRIAVTDAAEDGRATRAVCAVLAEALGVAPSRVSVRSGAGARNKVLVVEGDPTVLGARLDAIMQPG